MATEVKWIKIVTDIFDDEKILLIESLPGANSIIVIWFKLLCLAGKCNNDGVFLMNDRIPYTDEMLAAVFRRDVNEIRQALKVFTDLGMIEIVDGVITIPNWNKHQTLDSYEKKKERDRLYMAERRRKQKEIAQKSSDSNTTPSSYVVVSDKEIDIDIPPILSNDNIPPVTKELKAGKKIPPTLEEVKEYCTTNSKHIDPEAFWNYYNSNGWRVGKNPMKDWHSAIATWERNDRQYGRTSNKFETNLIDYPLSDV